MGKYFLSFLKGKTFSIRSVPLKGIQLFSIVIAIEKELFYLCDREFLYRMYRQKEGSRSY